MQVRGAAILSLLLALGACLAAAPSFGDASAPAATGPRISGFLLPHPIALRPFRLVDQNDDAFTADDLRQRWTLLFFGYTHCPDVCPTTLAQLRSVRTFVAQQRTGVDLSVVFVSLDPQRDSAAQLRQYSKQFGNDCFGVGGPPAEIDAFARQFKVKYAAAGSTSTAYFIDHTSSVALITPQAKLRAVFSVPLRPEAVAIDIQRIVQASAAPTFQPAPVNADGQP